MSESEGEDGKDSSKATTPDWPVTEEWLTSLLETHHCTSLHTDAGKRKIAMVTFSVKPGCESCDCAALSDILAVNVKYRLGEDADGIEALSFVVKLLPRDPFSRFFVTEAEFDRREIKFYTQVVPDLESLLVDDVPLKLPIPKCFYAIYSPPSEADPKPTESVLALENMKQYGYAGTDFSHGLDARQTDAAIEAIARVHALSLAFKIKKGEGKSLYERYPFLFQVDKASDSYQQLVEKGLPQLSQFLAQEKRHGELGAVREALDALRPRTKEIIANLLAPSEPMSLITHTDFWCNNLMFRESKNGTCECAILDWQMVTYSRPTNDIALLLVSSIPAELRRTETERILDAYWKSFTDISRTLGVLVEEDLGYDRDKLAQDYKRSQLLALLLCIGSIDLALGNEKMEERLVALLTDLHESGLLDADVICKGDD